MKQLFFIFCHWFGINTLFRRFHRGEIKVLLYHSISGPCGRFSNAVSVSMFRQHLAHLRRHYNVIGLNADGEFTGYRTDRVNILLTFDDGFIDNFNIAAQILYKEKITAIFFLIANCISSGLPPTFILNGMLAGQTIPPEFYTISTVEATELHNLGMVLGSHGRDHIDYLLVENAAAMEDAISSRILMEQNLGVPILYFAFPWGNHRAGQPDYLLNHYQKIFLTTHGFNRAQDRIIHRNEVTNLFHMRCVCSGTIDFFTPIIAKWRSLKKICKQTIQSFNFPY